MDWLNLWHATTTMPGEDISAFHIHDRCELLYVRKGHAQSKIGGHIYSFRAGQLAIISRLELHNLIPLSLPFERIGMHIHCDYLRRKQISGRALSVLEQHSSAFCPIFDLNGHPQIQALIEQLLCEFGSKEPASEEMLLVLLVQLLLCIYRMAPGQFSSTPRDESMEQARRHIESHCAEFFSLKKLSADYHLVPSHFIVRFKKYTGYTPLKYRNICRLTQARCMLLETTLSLDKISEVCGFTDLNSFVRSFRQTMNITPGRFRKIMQGMHADNS